MPDARITILVDNTAGEGLAAEHGLALWIEADGLRILFDTGQGPALPVNAERLGIDLGSADAIVLSHGHYDHTGGLPHARAMAPRASVHLHPAAPRTRYSVRDGVPKPIQMPAEARAALAALPAPLMRWVDRPAMLSPRVGLTGPVPRANAFEDTGGPFFLDPAGTRPDPIEDDLALWIDTDAGLVVCLGCCHSGLVNTLDYARACADGRRVHGVVGGLHLGSASEERFARAADALEAEEVAQIVLCHCTGEAAAEYLVRRLRGRARVGRAGVRMDPRGAA